MSAVRDKLKPFANANNARAFTELLLSLSGLALSLSAVAYFLSSGWWLFYAIGSLLAGLFLIKVFTIQHDCGHGSMFSSAFLNTWVGRLCSVITTMPFEAWKIEHNIHHSHVGDIHHMGPGDVPLLTVDAYKSQGSLLRRWYHVFRNTFFYLFVAPFFYFFLQTKVYNIWRKDHALSTILTNVAVLAAFGISMYFFGFWTVVFTYAPALYFGGIIGLALFYVQHNFPHAEWFSNERWSFESGALKASSLLKLPQPLEWFSHAIGYHHVHHLHTKVPGYRLREAYESVPEMREAKPLSFKDVVDSFKLKLWSFEKNRLVTFEEGKGVGR